MHPFLRIVAIVNKWLRKKDIAANTAFGEGIVGPTLTVEHQSYQQTRLLALEAA